MKDALLEIGTENLPASFVPSALAQMEELSQRILKENMLNCREVKVLGTYKRLALMMNGVEEKSPDKAMEITGPPARLLKDESGQFTPQSMGFARAQGVKPENLAVVATAKGDFLAVRKVNPGESAFKILSRIFPQIISSIQFPKNMVWEPSRFRFARPIRSLVALCGDRIIPFSVAGVKSGRKTQGLSALGSKPLAVTSPGKYLKTLENKLVMVSPPARRELLKKSLEQAGRRMKLNIDLDKDLIEETVFLVEHPVPVVGHFSLRFLKLPGTLLSTVLKKQLKFFPVTAASGELQPHFVGIRDGISEWQKEVQAGYESVVEARLEDAVFFFEKDLAISMETMNERLKGILFHEKLGTLYDKAERVKKLSTWLCRPPPHSLYSSPLKVEGSSPEAEGVDEDAVNAASGLCYADLASEVVRELPELQGIMGSEYSSRQSMSGQALPLPSRVSLIMRDFYLPVSAKSPLPETLEGSIVSMAGKIDTLTGDFAAGLVPSGSEDPHGLRRQAAGLVRICIEKDIPVSVPSALSYSLGMFEIAENKVSNVRSSLEDFIWQRASTIFEEMGFKFDEIRAVRVTGLDNLAITCRRLKALHDIRKEPDFDLLVTAFKRAANILKQAGVPPPPPRPLLRRSPPSDGGGKGEERGVEEDLLAEEPEKELARRLKHLNTRIEALQAVFGFLLMLKEMVAIKSPVDNFFDKVMVMADNPDLKRNRLNLMSELVRLFGSVADLSQLQ